jgi:sortase A
MVGRIEIPAAGVSAMIAEGDDARTLELAIGHMPGTALPGQRGHVVLAGHRDSFFRRIGVLGRGDLIRVTTASGTFAYRVAKSQIVSPRETRILRSGSRPGLTLVTCYPFEFIGPAPLRYVVKATQVAARRRSGEPDNAGPGSGAAGPLHNAPAATVAARAR